VGQADKLRAHLNASNETEAELLRLIDIVGDIERMADELTRRARRCTGKFRAFHEAIRRDQGLSSPQEDPVAEALGGGVAVPGPCAENIDPRLAQSWMDELLSPGKEAYGGEGESTSNNNPTAPKLNGENRRPVTAEEEARASNIQDLLQQGIPLDEAFRMITRRESRQ
jgi:hypothetical protein